MKCFKYLFSLPKIIFLKILYGKNIEVDMVQFFVHSLSVKNIGSGHIKISRGMKCRSNCTLLCDSGILSIGKNLFCNQNVMITALHSIVIKDNVTMGNNVVIVDHDHNYKKLSKSPFVCGSIFIDDGCWIGANVTVLKDVHLGKNCVVAAGTVVRPGVYPDNSLVYEKKDLVIKEQEKKANV